MLSNKADTYRADQPEQIEALDADRSLQVVLWTVWTLAVAATAAWNWRLDVAAQRPINLLGMVIYSLLTGLVGLLVITLVELWFEPERFME